MQYSVGILAIVASVAVAHPHHPSATPTPTPAGPPTGTNSPLPTYTCITPKVWNGTDGTPRPPLVQENHTEIVQAPPGATPNLDCNKTRSETHSAAATPTGGVALPHGETPSVEEPPCDCNGTLVPPESPVSPVAPVSPAATPTTPVTLPPYAGNETVPPPSSNTNAPPSSGTPESGPPLPPASVSGAVQVGAHSALLSSLVLVGVAMIAL